MIASQSYSQLATPTKQIYLPSNIARLAYADLIRYDACDSQLKLLTANFNICQDEIKLKDSIIFQQLFQLQKKDDIIGADKGMFDNEKAISDIYKKKYNGMKLKAIGGGVISAVLLVLLIIK